MKGIFYKLPIDFGAIIEKRELKQYSLEHSIAQMVLLITTTSFGGCKFDETFGASIWEIDFDLHIKDSKLREFISASVKKAISTHESRMTVENVVVNIDESKKKVENSIRIRKRIHISVLGKVKNTNRPFNFSGYFYMGPFSYF